MAVLNLKQISDKLNEEFAGDERRLIFWFDAKAEFVDDIDALELNNAKILHLELHEQLRMKYFLECEDTQTNYLIYAPYAKPPVQENHLADMIFYSKEFHTDKASVVASYTQPARLQLRTEGLPPRRGEEHRGDRSK